MDSRDPSPQSAARRQLRSVATHEADAAVSAVRPYRDELRQLNEMTIGDLLAIPSFGRERLADLASALQTECLRMPQTLPEPPESIELPEGWRLASDIRGHLDGFELLHTDPRFGGLLHWIGLRSSSELLYALETIPTLSVLVLNQGRRLVTQLSRAKRLSLKEEAIAVRGGEGDPRRISIICDYFGFGRVQPKTLAELGRQHHLTKEGVRWSCSPKSVTRSPNAVYMPVLQRVMDVLASSAGQTGGTIEIRLREEGLIERGTTVSQIIRYMRATRVKTPPVVVLPVHEKKPPLATTPV